MEPVILSGLTVFQRRLDYWWEHSRCHGSMCLCRIILITSLKLSHPSEGHISYTSGSLAWTSYVIVFVNFPQFSSNFSSSELNLYNGWKKTNCMDLNNVTFYMNTLATNSFVANTSALKGVVQSDTLGHLRGKGLPYMKYLVFANFSGTVFFKIGV